MKYRTKAKLYYYLTYLGMAIFYIGLIIPQDWASNLEMGAMIVGGIGLALVGMYRGKEHKKRYGQTSLPLYFEED